MRLFLYMLILSLLLTNACMASTPDKNLNMGTSNEDIINEISEDAINIQNGNFVSYWSPGKIKAEGPVLNSKKNGEWKYYYNDKTDQILNSSGIYRNDLKQGQWLTYYPDGRIMKKETYRNNELNGAAYVYTKEGIPFSSLLRYVSFFIIRPSG